MLDNLSARTPGFFFHCIILAAGNPLNPDHNPALQTEIDLRYVKYVMQARNPVEAPRIFDTNGTRYGRGMVASEIKIKLLVFLTR